MKTQFRETVLQDPMLDMLVQTRRGVYLYAPIVDGFEKFRQVVLEDGLPKSTQTALAVDYLMLEGGAV